MQIGQKRPTKQGKLVGNDAPIDESSDPQNMGGRYHQSFDQISNQEFYSENDGKANKKSKLPECTIANDENIFDANISGEDHRDLEEGQNWWELCLKDAFPQSRAYHGSFVYKKR